MKSKIITTLTLLICLFALGQTTFNKSQTITLPQPEGDAPYAIAYADIDADTFLDIVVGTQLGGSIFWFKNDGLGNFVQQSTITNTLPGVSDIVLVDINGDAAVDIITNSFNDDKVVWFANNPSSLGNFGVEQTIATLVDGPGDIDIADINQDTFADIAVALFYDNKVVWFAGDGSGNFGSENTIDSSLTNPGSIDIKDADGDGDLDVVIATSENINNTPGQDTSVIEIRLNTFAQNGMPNFINDQFSITTGKSYHFNVTFEDMDNDGGTEQDILATDIYGNLSWFKRDTPNTTYVETPFTTTISNPASIGFYDLDQNGDTFKDIILSSATIGTGTDLVWFKGNGGSSYSAETIIDATQSQAYKFVVADFDNDTDLDIASIAYNDDQISIFNNQKIVLSTEEFQDERFRIYPNPVSDYLRFEGSVLTETGYSIYTVLGNKLIEGELRTNTRIDLTRLNSGMYYFRLNDFGRVYKIIKN